MTSSSWSYLVEPDCEFFPQYPLSPYQGALWQWRVCPDHPRTVKDGQARSIWRRCRVSPSFPLAGREGPEPDPALLGFSSACCQQLSKGQTRMGEKITCIAANPFSSHVSPAQCPGSLCTDNPVISLLLSRPRPRLPGSQEKDFPHSCLSLPRRDIRKSSVCRQTDLSTCPTWQN